MSGVAYLILQQQLSRRRGKDSILKRAVGSDWKGKLSSVLYLVAIALAFVSSWLSMAVYVFVAVMWVIPDRRIERIIAGREA